MQHKKSGFLYINELVLDCTTLISHCSYHSFALNHRYCLWPRPEFIDVFFYVYRPRVLSNINRYNRSSFVYSHSTGHKNGAFWSKTIDCVNPLRWRLNGRDGVSNHQLMIVYSTVYSGADQSKHQSPASLTFVWGIHRRPVNSPHKWPVTRKMFPLDDVIM